MQASTSKKNDGPPILFIANLAWIITVIALTFYITHFFNSDLSEKSSDWGAFGDYIGGVLGASYAFLALIALLLTLKLQTIELRNSSRELENSAVALNKQSEALELQNFENRLFSMFSLHHEIVKDIDMRKKGGGSTIEAGRDSIAFIYKFLRNHFAGQNGDIAYNERISSSYEAAFQKYNSDLAHYFRFIYRIMKFIDESNVANKKEYTGIFRAQLSNPELAMLFYNGNSEHGINFKPLAEKYALFDNLDLSSLINRHVDVLSYDPSAFGEQQIN